MDSVARARAILRRPLELWYRVTLATLRRIGFSSGGESRGTLIFKTDRIGDFVLASGVIHLLVDQLGAENTTLMVSHIVEPLALREFPGCTVIPVPSVSDNWRGGIISGWSRMRHRNRGRRYRQLVNLRHHPTLFEDLLLSSIRADDSLSVARTELGESFWVRTLRSFEAHRTFKYPVSSDVKACFELEAHRIFAELFLNRPVKLAEILPQLKTFPVESNGSLLLLPHASDSIRGYPPSSIVEALVQAGLPEDMPIVLVGERSRAAELEMLSSEIRPRLLNSVSIQLPATLPDFILCVGRARCVFGMDSAGAHIASAFDKPGVFLLGGGHFRHFAPWSRSSRQHWIHLQLECFGCDWTCNQSYIKCLHDIPATAVGSALRLASTMP